MSHIRQQIREAVATAVTGLASGATVYESRVYDLPKATTLALIVDCGDEEIEYTTMTSPRTVQAELEVKIQALVINATSPEDSRDTLLKEVQVALASNDLSGVLKGVGLTLEGVETAYEDEAETRVMMSEMTWLAVYHFAENDPETAL